MLRVLADRRDTPARFLVLGSASPELLRQSSESLAGRIAFHEIAGFDLSEIGIERIESHWARGGFPRSFLAESDDESWRWRTDFVRTYLERDLPQLGFRLAPETLRRFWTCSRIITRKHGTEPNSLAHSVSRRQAFGTISTSFARRTWCGNYRRGSKT